MAVLADGALPTSPAHVRLRRARSIAVRPTVTTFESQNPAEITESVSRRFGEPYEYQRPTSDILWVSWRSGEGHVSMRCVSACNVTFRTIAAQATAEKDAAAHAKKEGTRPKAP